jgi:predicted hotdog family 3-hydroxylacyl-ACP dehydratase
MNTPATLDPQRQLPHRPPMLMVNEIIECNQERIECTALIQPDNPLLVEGLFPTIGGIELLAQASGILLATREGHDKAARPGAIGQIKTFQAYEASVAVGSCLNIEATFYAGNAAAAIFTGKVTMQQKTIFSGTLMIALLAEVC